MREEVTGSGSEIITEDQATLKKNAVLIKTPLFDIISSILQQKLRIQIRNDLKRRFRFPIRIRNDPPDSILIRYDSQGMIQSRIQKKNSDPKNSEDPQHCQQGFSFFEHT